MAQFYSIKELAPDERPRERLFLRGPASLSNGDLLAIILNTGVPGESVNALSQRLLVEHDGLLGLMKLDVTDLAKLRGIGPAKAAKLKATLEIASRVLAMGPDQRPQIASPDDVVNLVAIEMAALEQEQLRVVLLDSKHRVQSIRTVYQGSVNQAQVRIAELFREAIRGNAVAVVLVHNHPSGDPTPSGADVSLTADVVRAGDLLNIDVLDHLVIGRGRHVSMRRLGLGFASSGGRS
ncbi:MAG: DNA repair protein RadC [Thermomicrobiales bacterium]|nr:DNA repair protein RadC [Thermomicrobiales bacterium]